MRRMALEAKHLGIERIVCAGSDISGDYYGVSVVSGTLLSPTDVRDFGKLLKKARKTDIVMAYAKDAGLNRSLLTSGKLKILRGIECAPKKAFDDVCAVSAVEKGVAIDISLSAIVNKKGIQRQKALISFAEILKFQRKFGFHLTISSGANSYAGLRSVSETESLCSLFGMECDEVKTAMNAVDILLNPRRSVEVIDG